MAFCRTNASYFTSPPSPFSDVSSKLSDSENREILKRFLLVSTFNEAPYKNERVKYEPVYIINTNMVNTNMVNTNMVMDSY